MKRSDKIRALSLLGSGKISLEKFKEMTDIKSSEYKFKYMPQEMMDKVIEFLGSPEEELTIEERVDRIDRDFLFACADCIQNQYPNGISPCDNKYYNPEDTNCQACDDERRLQKIKSFA